VLGEFGDDPNRYTTAKCRKNYAGTSPSTVTSGRKRAVLGRHVRNRRLYDAIDQWVFCALSRSPGARTFYDQRRAAGDLHHQALRALANRSSASGMDDCATTPSTTNTKHGHTAKTSQLDGLHTWDVQSGSSSIRRIAVTPLIPASTAGAVKIRLPEQR
jgi:Transposase IS116/IS110/IS902 family